MLARKAITIAGGGLAGLTLGIALRQRQVPVTVWEAGNYPRHRVCGEFISGHGQAVLERLGLLSRCHEAGGVCAMTAMFIRGSSPSPVRQLAAPALCISRHVLDAFLADLFQQMGGELRVNSPWTSAPEQEGLVWACGRGAPPPGKAPGWFGVKAHVPRHHALELAADLEMHLSPEACVGINRIGDGEVNVCGFFRFREGGQRPESQQDWLRGEDGSLLRERLKDAAFDPDSVCSVAGLDLKPQHATGMQCCIGDALTMTPPVTGNGMSMAFESAEMAVEPLTAYSQEHLEWSAARQDIVRRCDTAFAHRLEWARLLQWMLVSPTLHGPLGTMLFRSESLWRHLFAETR